MRSWKPRRNARSKAFLILTRVAASGMRGRPKSSWLVILISCLIVGGLATPILAAGQTGPLPPTQAQLSALISAAEGSGLYARSVVGYASSHGISTASAQALISHGDAMLASAMADARSGADADGALAVQAAMNAYTSAAASASVAIGNAGLAGSLDSYTVEQAIAEVNATASAVASVGASACGQAGVSLGGAAMVQACSQVEAQVAAARSSLSEAAAYAAQANGSADAAGLLSQAMEMVFAARGNLNSTQAGLLTIASYGYVQRAGAYVTAVIDPLAAQANSTIASEESVNSSYSQFQKGFSSYAQAQAASVSSMESSTSMLSAAISAVDTGAVGSNSTAAEGVSTQVNSDLSALLALPGISVLAGVVSDIGSCQAAAGAFNQAVRAANSQSDGYSLATFSAFSAYLTAMDQDTSNVRSTGTAYVTSYQTVIADLASLQAVPGVATLYSDLANLQVSGSVSGVESSLSQATVAMATVQTDISAYASAVTASAPAVSPQQTLLSAGTSAEADAQVYLNATGSAAMSQAAAAVQAVSQTAASLGVLASSSANSSIGAFAAAGAGVTSSGGALTAQTNSAVGFISAAAASLEADINFRIASTLAAQASIADALSLFSSLSVSRGVSDMAQASLDLRVAAAENVMA